MNKRFLKIAAISFAAVVAIGALGYTVTCPCGPLPGVRLSGTEVVDPVDDWSFANDAKLCQIQVQTWKPHSLNLNCYSHSSELFVSCSGCAEKSWSAYAPNSMGRVKIGDEVFPVQFARLTDPDALDRSWSARLEKLGQAASPRPEHWWSFQLTQITSSK